jgi:phosphohistidine phosphatase
MQIAPVRTIRQAGVIPHRATRDGFEVLLVTNTSGCRWLVPKGNLEPGLSAQQSAVREALEEAGVRGVIDPVLVGTFEQTRGEVRRLVDIYPLAVRRELSRWREMDRRQRRWIPIEAAIGASDYPGLGACFAALARRLAKERAA